MMHGDDRGLRIPPKMAPIEAVFVPIVRSGDDRAVELCATLAQRLTAEGFRVRVDTRDAQPGWKYSEWDVRGVPVRIEIGPRDVDAQSAVLARRDRGREDPDQRPERRDRGGSGRLARAARRHPALALRAGQGISGQAHAGDRRPRRILRALPRDARE